MGCSRLTYFFTLACSGRLEKLTLCLRGQICGLTGLACRSLSLGLSVPLSAPLTASNSKGEGLDYHPGCWIAHLTETVTQHIPVSAFEGMPQRPAPLP